MHKLFRSLRPATWLAMSALATALLAAALWKPHASAASAQRAMGTARPLLTAPVTGNGAGTDQAAFDGIVQAVRQTTLAAQVSGTVIAISVKPGDRVQAGQVLVRLDARSADLTAAASSAQVQAARAAQEAATRDFERQKLLRAQNFISQGALDRAEADYKSAQAGAAAQLASAGAAKTQTDFYVIRAPYTGVVAEVPATQGDMALPGKPLVSLYDPAALRVSAQVPQSVAAGVMPRAALVAEVAGAPAGRITPVRVEWLPTVDPATHTREVRLDLPPGSMGLAPGMFARVWLPMDKTDAARFFIPRQAVLRRAEMTAVYVVGTDGLPLLRQVRLGRAEGERVEVLTGLSQGEQVAVDPQAAAGVN